MKIDHSYSATGSSLGSITLKMIQLLFAFCVAILTGMTYLAYQGKLNDWRIQFNFAFWKYQPEPGSIFWSTLVFGAATGICLIAFFYQDGWGRKFELTGYI